MTAPATMLSMRSPRMSVAYREAGRTPGTKLPAGRPLIQTP